MTMTWFFQCGLATVLLLQTAGHGVGETSEIDPQRPRLADLGIRIGTMEPGPLNAISDVAGVRVGHCNVIAGDDVRTGVTAIHPHGDNVFLNKVPAAVHVANGFGKFIGLSQIEELGVIETPIVLTNTLSSFAAADALVKWTLRQPGCQGVLSVNPVVGECNDGYLNDIRQQAVTAQHVWAALDQAADGPVAEGCVGGGVGVRCLGWKGGIGTASRKLSDRQGGYTVGVLVQTNFGGRLTVAGVPIPSRLPRVDGDDPSTEIVEHGSCIVIVATDAPLDARRLKRLASRAPLGLGAVGSPISHGSGDYVLAFSTARQLRSAYQSDDRTETAVLLRDEALTPLFQAVRDATEEAVLNSLLQAETTSGFRGRSTAAIDPERLRHYWEQGRLEDPT